jgi:hypothetical protein
MNPDSKIVSPDSLDRELVLFRIPNESIDQYPESRFVPERELFSTYLVTYFFGCTALCRINAAQFSLPVRNK